MTRRSPWLAITLYTVVVVSLLWAAYVWHGIHWDPSALVGLFLVGWMLWLSVDRANVLDYAEQASDSADEAARQYDRVVAHQDLIVDRINDILGYLESRDKNTHPDTAPITIPMEQAWDTSAEQLIEDQAEPTTRLHTRQFSGRTFQFRTP